MDSGWQVVPDDGLRFEALYRYVHLNGLRDDLNMQRLQIVSDRQQLAELSDAPISIAVARLPVRIVTIGIPLLLAALHVLPADLGVLLSLWLMVLMLALLGYLVFLVRGRPVLICLTSAVVTGLFGVVVIVLKTSLQH